MDAIDAVGVLADQHARVLLLDEQGLDGDAIAARLGIDPRTVPGLLAVARRKLSELEREQRLVEGPEDEAEDPAG